MTAETYFRRALRDPAWGRGSIDGLATQFVV
jgi:hypothetical protein